MRTPVLVALCAAALFAACGPGAENPVARRWFYASRSLRDPAQVDEVRTLVQRAVDAGLNGMVLDAGFDRITLEQEPYFANLDSVKRICDAAGVELIPLMFSAGHGNQLLAHDRDMAAALPVRGVRFAVQGTTAVHVPSTKAAFFNGGFERYDGDRFGGFWFHDRPGRVSFVDTMTYRSGKTAIRFEKFRKSYRGHARVMQEMDVDTYRNYVITAWVKTENVAPAGCLRILVLTRDRRELAPRRLRIPATTDGWMKVELPFNSMGNHTVRVYVGGWGAEKGRFWLDDLAIRETALTGLVRRAGAPVTVRNTDGTTLNEGRDFRIVRPERSDFRFDRPEPRLVIPSGSAARDGDTLSVSYYQLQPVRYRQVSVCLSEEKPYDVWQAQVERVHGAIAPQTYFLSMDEIRTGGTCRACTDRNVAWADILGDCVVRQRNIVRSVNPRADLWMWSDMFDPNHNAVKGYYLLEGDPDGVWDRIPSDVGIMCWSYGRRKKSLAHFSGLGLRTMGACFYDVPEELQMHRWREALEATQDAQGMMYTTWDHDYSQLEAFGRIATPAPAVSE